MTSDQHLRAHMWTVAIRLLMNESMKEHMELLNHNESPLEGVVWLGRRPSRSLLWRAMAAAMTCFVRIASTTAPLVAILANNNGDMLIR